MQSAFRFGGLASGLDTNSLIDRLIELEGQPLKVMAAKQARNTVRISSIASLVSKLDALSGTAKSLGTGGVSVISATGTYSDFALSGTATNEGRYTIRSEVLAQSAKARSGTFASAIVPAATGDLQIKIDGVTSTVTGLAGKGLGDVAAAINTQVPSVSASVVSDGTSFYLSLTRKDTGFTIGGVAGTALELVPAQDAGLSLAITQTAVNAVAWVDGLRIERKGNEIKDVIAGVTISLKAASNVNTEAVFGRNLSATAANLQRFVDGFNDIAEIMKANLRPTPGVTKAAEGIADASLIALQGLLRKFLSTEVNTTGAIRTVTDLGVKLGKDGTVTLDQAVLDSALVKDPTAVNSVFAKVTTGMGAAIATMVNGQTNVLTGTLVSRRKSIEAESKRIDVQATSLNATLDRHREQLVKQFTAMERIISNFNNIGTYLQNQRLPGSGNNG